MSRWNRDELEDAFEIYQKVALEAYSSGNLDPWVDLFTEDCTYIEHYYGQFGGREAVRKWVHKVMKRYPMTEMKYFPVEWYVIDEEKGWVVCYIWNRMTDPGDGSVHQAPNISILQYAGNGMWKGEEDIYNPKEFEVMIEAWEQAKEKTGLGRGPAGR